MSTIPLPSGTRLEVLLCVCESRRHPLAALIEQLEPGGHVAATGSVADACLRVLRSPVDLLVLDDDLPNAESVPHHLGRLVPAQQVLRFAVRPVDAGPAAHAALDWVQAPAALRQHLGAWRARAR